MQIPIPRLANNCYYISRDQVWGDEAFARCIHIGGYLANFETLEEAMLMKQKLKKMNSGLHFFVGGRNINKRKPGGDWRWIKNGTMTKMSYFPFGNVQPVGSYSSAQDCMFFYAGEYYRFYDIHCDNYNGGYICEK
uniref:C-type lectin domain-containing protein n=1 Tax=Magallana gigas TaxID=29159 RepID=A0A8W8LCY5_MAGGI|nr:perlucin-like protein isoform X10 [Crassostrea gigas]